MGETQPDQRQRLARLAFAGVIGALVIIYMVSNFDRYEDLSSEFRYSELVDMADPIKETIEAAILSGNVANVEFLDSGEAGLPNEVLVLSLIHI